MRGDAPAMAEWIVELPGTIAVELVLDRSYLRRPFRDCTVEDIIDVVDVDADCHRGASDCLRPAVPHVRELVGEHDQRVADLELGVAHLAAWPLHAHALPGAEDGCVEVDRIVRAIDREIRCDLRITLG